MVWIKLFGVVPWFKMPDPPTPAPSSVVSASNPDIASTIQGAQQRREMTARVDHKILAGLDIELIKLQTTLGEKQLQAATDELAGTPNPVLTTEITTLEQKKSALNARVVALEAYLRAKYPEYWKI